MTLGLVHEKDARSTPAIPVNAELLRRLSSLLGLPRLVVRVGRLVQCVARVRGGGTALPGLVVERLDPHFLTRALGSLRGGVVVVTGTNGKTTTTKMTVELLRASGMRVITNKSGSNFTRGIIASLLDEVGDDGALDADIAVLELDEAHAVSFVDQVRPRITLLLNVMRDQLDRFGEIDYTAGLLEKVALATSDGVVLNRDDPLVRRIADKLAPHITVRYFGIRESLRGLFPSDHDLYGSDGARQGSAPSAQSADVTLSGLHERTASFTFGTEAQAPVELSIEGIHNSLNAAAALSLVRLVLGDDADTPVLMRALQTVRPAFGRGESIDLEGGPVEIVLVKNPAGFRLVLSTYSGRRAATMIAINDGYADGRDTSWLWDVDFEGLEPIAVVSGTRAYDMAVRLQYDGVDVDRVESSLSTALDQVLRLPGPKRIYCTYTAMMAIRRILASRFDLASIE